MSDRIEPTQLLDRLRSKELPTVSDVRSPEEYAQRHLSGALNIPLDELPARLGEIEPDRLVVPY